MNFKVFLNGFTQPYTPEYKAWAQMKYRCNNPNAKEYPHYGGRGISVCEQWITFENFYADMGPRPNPSMSLDRMDNNGSYYPSNCRWATRIQQHNNTRRNTVIDGRTISEIARIVGVSHTAINYRQKKGIPLLSPRKTERKDAFVWK